MTRCGNYFGDACDKPCKCTLDAEHAGACRDEKLAPLPGSPVTEAIAAYRAARTAWLAAGDRSDAAFARYFAKLQRGEPTNGAATARLDNLTNYASTTLYQAQGALYKLDLDPWDVDDADGVDHTPVGS